MVESKTFRGTQLGVAILLIVGFVYLLIETALDKGLAKTLVVNGTYYIILLLVVTWLILLARTLLADEFSFSSFFKKFWPGLLAAALITVSVFISVEPGYRTLADETNLISVSKSMYYDHTIYNSRMGRWFNDEYHSMYNEVPKRPVAFSFTLHLLHQIFGYSHQNGFILNGIVLFVLLFMAYAVSAHALGIVGGLAAMILIAAQPIILISATSSGFDLFATTLTAAMLLIAYFYLKKPSPDRLLLLWVTLLLLLNARYECFIYSGIVVLLLLVLREVPFSYIKERISIYGLSLFFVLPFIWQMLLTDPDLHRNNQKIDHLFGLDYFITHAKQMLTAHLGPHSPPTSDPSQVVEMPYPYAVLLNWLGLILFVLIIYWLFKNREKLEKYQRKFILVLSACVILRFFHDAFILEWLG